VTEVGAWPSGPKGAADLTDASAQQTLNRACTAAGLDPAGARLLRLGEHAMFRLGGPVVVRIARSAAFERDARKEVSVARWLQTVEYPAVRALPIEQPLLVDDRVVTFWQALSDDGTDFGTTAEVAALLVKLHQLTPPAGLALAALQPFARVPRRIDSALWLCTDDRDSLRAMHEELAERYSELEFELPQGVIHGDASVGNVIRDVSGQAVLIDLDGFAIGPREWDLVLTAMYFDSFGWHTKAEYEQFAEVYGFDVMQWPGYPVLRDVREFLMVTWLSQKGADDEHAAAEVRKRIASLRSAGSRRDWLPF
jgi:aminoglycoside phosphotransferase (APT) family kinase protein